MSASSPSPPPRRGRLPLRFSLRVLLLAVTAFAIGFPIWYRWPYEEVEVRDISSEPYASGKEFRSYTTWQRQWGRGRLMHGASRTVRDGITSSTSTYRQGKQHGPYQLFYVTGPLSEDGRYVDGERDGICTTYHEDGSVKATAMWRRGQKEGPASISGRSGRHQLVFAAGRVIEVDNQPVDDRLGALLAAGKVDSPEMADVLKSVTGLEYSNVPLRRVADSLSQNFQVPIIVDPLHVEPNVRVNCNGQDIDFSSCLAVMAAEHGLGCDFRYGLLWITSPEDVKDWRDPTGVTDIQPPKYLQLATSWNEPVACSAKEEPLAEVLKKLVQPLAIGIDVSAIERADEVAEKNAVTLYVYGHPFRYTLAILLYQARCRCELRGETLVILPPSAQ